MRTEQQLCLPPPSSLAGTGPSVGPSISPSSTKPHFLSLTIPLSAAFYVLRKQTIQKQSYEQSINRPITNNQSQNKITNKQTNKHLIEVLLYNAQLPIRAMNATQFVWPQFLGIIATHVTFIKTFTGQMLVG